MSSLVLFGDPLLSSCPDPASPEDAVLTFFADRMHGIQKLRRQLRAHGLVHRPAS